MNREKMLKQVLDSAKREYDFILLDCMPSLGMLTINALAAADAALIPVQAQYLSAKGLEQLLQTVQKVRRQINPKLKIEGILLTMTDSRTNYGKQISNLIRQAYGKHLKVFEQTILAPSVQQKPVRQARAFSSMTPKARWQKPTNLLQRRCWRMPIDSGNLALKGLDDLFSTEENRQEEQREQVQQIPIDELHPFTNHPSRCWTMKP